MIKFNWLGKFHLRGNQMDFFVKIFVGSHVCHLRGHFLEGPVLTTPCQVSSKPSLAIR